MGFMSAGHDYSFKRETGIYLLWRLTCVFNEHFLSYPSTESAYQSLQHLCICIFNSHLINKFYYILYWPEAKLPHLPEESKVTTFYKCQNYYITRITFSNYGFSIHLSRYQYHCIYLLSLCVFYHV